MVKAKMVEVHIVKGSGPRRGRLPAEIGEDLLVQEMFLFQFSNLQVGHWFDIKIEDEWILCEIIHTYDRHRTKDIVVYATKV